MLGSKKIHMNLVPALIEITVLQRKQAYTGIKYNMVWPEDFKKHADKCY